MMRRQTAPCDKPLSIRAHRQYGVQYRIPSPHAVVTTREQNVDIAAWLRALGLQQYEQAFRDNAVDAAVLPELTGDDLKDLGVRSVGHRRKLLAAIAALRSDTVPIFNTPVAASNVERRQLTAMFCDLV